MDFRKYSAELVGSFLFFTIGQGPSDLANDRVMNDDRLARHAKLDRALVIIRQAAILQFFHAPAVARVAL